MALTGDEYRTVAAWAAGRHLATSVAIRELLLMEIARRPLKKSG